MRTPLIMPYWIGIIADAAATLLLFSSTLADLHSTFASCLCEIVILFQLLIAVFYWDDPGFPLRNQGLIKESGTLKLGSTFFLSRIRDY